MRSKINISFEYPSLQNLRFAGVIKKCILATLTAESIDIPVEINVFITNNRGIQGINLASRGVDAPTDVLSFPMFQLEAGKPPVDWNEYLDPETGLCPLGDMAISLERAISQAKTFGHSSKREVGYLTIHSILHLLGYDHMDEGEEKAKMRSREEAIASTIAGLQRL